MPTIFMSAYDKKSPVYKSNYNEGIELGRKFLENPTVENPATKAIKARKVSGLMCPPIEEYAFMSGLYETGAYDKFSKLYGF